MSREFQEIYFNPSNADIVIGIVCWVLLIVFSYLTIKKSKNRLKVSLLEAIRFLCVTCVILLLWEPYLKSIEIPETSPKIAVLWDASQSMKTVDVPSSADGSVIAREQLVSQLLASELWSEIATNEDADLLVSAFSEPVDGIENTSDLFTPLVDLVNDNDNLLAVVMLSDGDWNAGSPPIYAAQKLRTQQVPLFTIPIGSATPLPDLILSDIAAPSFGILGEPIQISFKVTSTIDREIVRMVNFTCSESGQRVTKQLTIPPRGEVQESVIWKVERESESKVNVLIPPVSDEVNLENNTGSFIVRGKEEELRVLVIDSTPRWEYRFIRNALSRDQRVSIDCLLYHPSAIPGGGTDYLATFPSDPTQLQQYDVVFVGDVGISEDQLSATEAELLAGLVKNQATGIVFIPGQRGHQQSLLGSPLGELIPVVLDESAPEGVTSVAPVSLSLTKLGQSSLLTTLGDSAAENIKIWQSLPGFYWHSAVLKAKAGSQILATHGHSRNRFGRLPLLVTSQAGNGKVLYLAHDSAWRWRRGVEDLYHYRFWGQVARWMSYQRKMAVGDRIRLYYTPEQPEPGQTIYFSANATADDGSPLADDQISLMLISPTNKSQLIDLSKSDDIWGGFTGSALIDTSGVWRIEAQIGTDVESRLSTTLISPAINKEKISQEARPEVLAEMAKLTDGAMLRPEQLGSFPSLIDALDAPEPRITLRPLWGDGIYLFAILSLLTSFWVIRKLYGYF